MCNGCIPVKMVVSRFKNRASSLPPLPSPFRPIAKCPLDPWEKLYNPDKSSSSSSSPSSLSSSSSSENYDGKGFVKYCNGAKMRQLSVSMNNGDSDFHKSTKPGEQTWVCGVQRDKYSNTIHGQLGRAFGIVCGQQKGAIAIWAMSK